MRKAAGRGDRRRARSARRRGGPCHRLLRRRHGAGRDAGAAGGARARRTRSPRPPSSPPRSISARRATSSFFLGDEQMELIRQLSADKGYLDGRYMAATFNLLRGRDLIWSYVTNNYLLGEEYPQFDLLYWNSRHDQPAGRLAPILPPAALPREQAGPARRDHHRRHADRPQEGDDADLRPGRPRGPYRAAAERVEDHPPFRRADALRAGGLGPYRRRGQPARGARNTNIGPTRRRSTRSSSSSPARPRPRAAGGPTGSSGSRGISAKKVPAKGGRVPGKGKLEAIEDAPGSYVKAR